MATKELAVQIDEEVFEKLSDLVLRANTTFNCVVNEALKFYLTGRVPSGQTPDVVTATRPRVRQKLSLK